MKRRQLPVCLHLLWALPLGSPQTGFDRIVPGTRTSALLAMCAQLGCVQITITMATISSSVSDLAGHAS